MALWAICTLMTSCGGGGGGGPSPTTPTTPSPPPTPALSYAATSAHVASASEITDLVSVDDGAHVYLIASGGVRNDSRIDHLILDQPSGAFDATSDFVRIANPMDIAYAAATDEIMVLAREPTRVERFSRDAASGALTRIDSFVLENEGLADLAFLRAEYSPDGLNAYLWAGTDYTILTLDLRTAATRAMTTVESDGAFSNANELGFSADGRHVYAGRDYIDIFERDPTDGSLTPSGRFAEEQDHPGPLTNLDDIYAIQSSSDGAFLYVLATVGLDADPGQARASVAVLSRDSGTGALSYVDAAAYSDSSNTGARSTDLHLSNDGGDLYLSEFLLDLYPNGIENRRTALLRIPVAAPGVLGAPQSIEIRSGSVAGLEVRPILGGDRVLAFQGGLLQRFDLDAAGNGLIAGPRILLDPQEIHSIAGVEELVPVPGSDLVVVRSQPFDSTDDYVTTLRLDSAAGSLTAIDSQSLLGNGRDTSSTAVTPDGRHIYAARSIVDLWRVGLDPATGRMEPLQPDPYVHDFTGYYAESVTVSGDGKHVYVPVQVINAQQFNQSTAGILAFERDATTGELTLIEAIDSRSVSGGRAKRGILRLILSRDGEFGYLLNRFSEEIQIYARDPGTGELSFRSALADFEQAIGQQQLSGLWEASDAVISSDDRHLYVSADEIYVAVNSRGYATNTVSMMVFERNLSDGSLTLVQQLERDGDDAAGNPVYVGGGARSVSLSADGNRLLMVTQATRTPNEHVRQSGRRIDVFDVGTDGRLSHAADFSGSAAGPGVRAAMFQGNQRIIVGNVPEGSVQVFEER